MSDINLHHNPTQVDSVPTQQSSTQPAAQVAAQMGIPVGTTPCGEQLRIGAAPAQRLLHSAQALSLESASQIFLKYIVSITHWIKKISIDQ